MATKKLITQVKPKEYTKKQYLRAVADKTIMMQIDVDKASGGSILR